MKLPHPLVASFLLLVSDLPLHAQQTPAPPGSGAVTRSQQDLVGPNIGTLQVPQLTRPLTLADFAGMHPSASLRDTLGHVDSLSQYEPFDTRPATERTEVWLGRTQSTLYVVYVCFDSRPALIRSHLSRRENIDGDDTVSLLIDPFQDRRRGILFQVNPMGVQADANWTDATNDQDYSYDQIWDSAAVRTPQGWMALMAIPFRSIRSRAAAPDWGIVVGRNMPRLSEIDNWPHVSQQVSGTLTQEGTAHGLAGASPQRFQVNPYALGQRIRQLNDDDPLHPYFSNRNLQGAVGGDVKAIVNDTVVIDGTINPDFSQVESDQPQFRVNQRYAILYPELRPFFLENSNYFTAPITLLYTRTVVHPEFGLRASGKIGHTNFGFLTIDDRAPGEFVPDNDPLHGKRAVTTVARVSQDFGKQSSIGAMYAQRTLAGQSNRVGGVDLSLLINNQWSMRAMMVESSTHHLDGTYSAGPATRLGVTRSGRNFNLFSTYRDFSQGYETDTGFVTVPQVRQSSSNASYAWYPNRHGVQSIQIQPQLNFAFDRSGHRVFRYNENDLIATLTRNSQIILFAGDNSDTLSPANYSSLAHFTNFSSNYAGLQVKLAPIPQFSARLNYLHGATPNYSPAGSNPPQLLHDDQLRAYVTLQPIGPLTVDNIYLLDRTNAAHPLPTASAALPTPASFRAGDLAYESQTLRTKINYQFTRSFSLRAIVEYDSVLANPLVTSLARTKQVSSQVLFTWLPHPGTALYVGYNNNLQNLDRKLCNRMPNGEDCDPANTATPYAAQYLATGRQIFVKASYLLRF